MMANAKGTRKCACSLCVAYVTIPKRFCEGCLVNCHTIMSAANSLDDIAGCDFSNIDWSSDTVRSQTVEHGGGFAAVQATDTAEGIYGETTDNGGDAMGEGMGGKDAAQAAAEAFAEYYAYSDGDEDADGGEPIDGEDDDEMSAQEMSDALSNGAGSGDEMPPFIYVITRRSYTIVENEFLARGVVGTAKGIAVFPDLKTAQRFSRPLRRRYAHNKYRCKKIKLS